MYELMNNNFLLFCDLRLTFNFSHTTTVLSLEMCLSLISTQVSVSVKASFIFFS